MKQNVKVYIFFMFDFNMKNSNIYILRKQRLCLVKKKTPKGGGGRGGWIGFLKSFQSQQIQTQYKKNKKIELENSNSSL